MPKKKPEPMWRRYLRFFGPSVAADVNDEVDDHIARLESELRAAGTPGAEIAAAVRERFGDPDAIRARLRRADESRLKRSLWIDAFGNFGQDVAYALRRLRQRPGFTAAVVIVLALGVGATTAMFSAVDAAMLRPLPFPNAEQLVAVNDVSVRFDAGPGNPQPTFHYPDLDDIAAMKNTFSSAATYAAGSLNLADPGRPMRVQVGVVTPSFFTTIGVAPANGRAFSHAEGVPNGPLVAVLSDALWRGHFGGRPMLDSVVSLSGKRYTVVGVMSPGFSFPSQSDLWIPMTDPNTFDTFAAFRSWIPGHTVARMAPGVDDAAAERDVRLLWTRTAAVAATADSNSISMFRDQLAGFRATGFTKPLQSALVGDRRTALLVLLGATAVLLLIACANITSLLLSQAAVRRHEIAIRAILGAGRHRIVRQLLTESVLLSVGGTALGVGLAPLVLRLLNVVMPVRLAGLAPAQVDGRVLAFAAVLALVTGVGFGLWPAWGASRADLADGARSGGRGSTGGGASRGRRILVGAELALAVLLLVGSGLMLRSFARLVGVNSGVDARHLATLELNFGADAGPTAARVARVETIIQRLTASPGIDAAGVVNVLPLGGDGGISISVRPEGQPLPPPDKQQGAYYLIASGGFFQAMGIPLLEGRTFTAADDSGAHAVAVISRAMAKGLWPGVDPIGRRFPFVGNSMVTVIGVVGDVHVGSLDAKPNYQMYFPFAQKGSSYLALIARGALPPTALLARLRDVVHAVDPSQAVYRVRMMDDVVGASVAPQRTNALLITLFGALALVLTSLGVYAVVAYSVAQRRREFGIRAALGATGRDLIALVSRELVWVMVLGLAVGLGGAWAASRVLTSLLFGVTTHDPLTFVLAPLALIIPAAIATLIPARRAARTNPVDVIREE